MKLLFYINGSFNAFWYGGMSPSSVPFFITWCFFPFLFCEKFHFAGKFLLILIQLLSQN